MTDKRSAVHDPRRGGEGPSVKEELTAPAAMSSAGPECLPEDRMVAEQLEHERARREELSRTLSEARWFVAAFALSVCLCFLIFAVL
jgi:hypothetical protein